jgi:hypothetical protein
MTHHIAVENLDGVVGELDDGLWLKLWVHACALYIFSRVPVFWAIFA